MKKMLTSIALLSCGLGVITPVIADNDKSSDSHSEQAFTIAVYGDAPYGCKAGECPIDQPSIRPDTANGPNPGDPRQIETTPVFINAINADPKVRLVMHVGDIHSGSQYCTLAYNQTVFNLWKQFKNPLIYTPGDNEWTDCQKSKEGGNVKDSNGNYVDYANGNPVANLALIRSMFFPNPGETLGVQKKKVISQAQTYDPLHPSDAEYVENVLWEQSGVLFVTLNIPGGSNNDDDKWYGAAKTGEQIQEAAQRTAANQRWLDAAFTKAQSDGVKAVVIAEQADMWDLDGTNPLDKHIANYKPFIDTIAAHVTDLGKPVLLINGDSHTYRSDNPLVDNAPCVIETSGGVETACGMNNDSYDNQPYSYHVPNFHRIVVHGSYFPLEYLRLTIDPRKNYAESDTSFGPFTWDRVKP